MKTLVLIGFLTVIAIPAFAQNDAAKEKTITLQEIAIERRTPWNQITVEDVEAQAVANLKELCGTIGGKLENIKIGKFKKVNNVFETEKTYAVPAMGDCKI